MFIGSGRRGSPIVGRVVDRQYTTRGGEPRRNGSATAIYFLLRRGERSHWHRIDAVEIWHWHAGSPLLLEIADANGVRTVRLGSDLAAGEQPQGIVPPHAWQAAASTGDWTLVGCTVAPGFDFGTFELAPQGWMPKQ